MAVAAWDARRDLLHVVARPAAGVGASTRGKPTAARSAAHPIRSLRSGGTRNSNGPLARREQGPTLTPVDIDPFAIRLTTNTRLKTPTFAKKPLYAREGANVLLVRDGAVLERDDGPYGKEGHVRQALAELPVFAGRHALVGSWIVGAEPAGLCMREETRRITTDRARFVPHLILG